jgi:O-antigen/teichoic acid export membrane protein
MVKSIPTGLRAYRRELFSNQIWHGANFGAKALFLAVLTPLMVRTWGLAGYGEFALASSLLVSMSVLDGGVRNYTRLRLCQALSEGDLCTAHRTLGIGLVAFGLVAVAAFLLTALFAWGGHLGSVFQLSAEGNRLLVGTTGLIGILMLSIVALEPLAAEGKLSWVKAANTVGAVTALPVVGAWVYFHGSVSGAVYLYFVCLIVPNLWLIARHKFFQQRPWETWRNIHWIEIIGAWRGGWWYYVTTLSLIAKTHALTFVVSAVSGPAIAGFFYILLRISEIIGTLGASASDTALASLTSAKTPEERVKNFIHAYQYSALFTFYGAVGVALAGDYLLRFWLGTSTPLPAGVGWALAAYGLAGAFSKIVVNSAMGLGVARGAALANAAEAGLVLCAGALLPSWLGLNGVFWGGALAVLVLVPSAHQIAQILGRTPYQLWIAPCLRYVPGLSIAAGCLAGAIYLQQIFGVGAAGFLLALIGAWDWRHLHGPKA